MRGNLLFDFTFHIQKKRFHGGGEYGYAVLNELLLRDDLENCGLFIYRDRPLDLEVIERAIGKHWRIHVITNIRSLSRILRENNYSVLYSAFPYSSTEWKGVKFPSYTKFIYTIHGVRGIEVDHYKDVEEEFFKKRIPQDADYIFSAGMMNSDAAKIYRDVFDTTDNRRIISISESSKFAICYNFPMIHENEITVLKAPEKVTSYVEDDSREKKYLREKGIVLGNYALFVAADIYYKNVMRGVLAFDELFERGLNQIPSDYKVVVCGVINENNYSPRIRHLERFVFLKYVETDELEILYKNAHLFIYPTLNEGFGYPPIEAMKYGTVCLCSGSTSVPEVCGDTVIYFNPLLIDDICVKILEGFSSEVREMKKALIKERLPLLLEGQKLDLHKLTDILVENE